MRAFLDADSVLADLDALPGPLADDDPVVILAGEVRRLRGCLAELMDGNVPALATARAQWEQRALKAEARVTELEAALADEQLRRHRVEVVSAFQAEALRRIRVALDWAEEATQKGVEP